MGTTAIISPQIVDSTSIGRDLITAADQAAAQAIIGVTGVDTGADYTWTGNHQFDEPVELISTDWADANGVINQPSVSGYTYFAFNGSNVFRASALDFIPMSDGTKALGRSDLRFSDVLSVDGDFSGTLSAVTVAAQTNNLTLQSNSGSALISLAEGGTISLTAYSSIYQQFTNTGVGYRQNCYPIFATLDLGSAATPWNNGYFNNLSSAVGGSYKLYNLGTEGDADTEYLETSVDTNKYVIAPKKTGAGAVRQFELEGCYGANFGNIFFDTFGFLNLRYGQSSTAHISLRSTGTELAKDIFPNIAALDVLSLGKSTARFGEFYSVDGDFSGDVIMAANVDFTGLPTSDPVVAGRLWNDSGTLKISAG